MVVVPVSPVAEDILLTLFFLFLAGVLMVGVFMSGVLK
jgi:hypothetical protein